MTISDKFIIMSSFISNHNFHWQPKVRICTHHKSSIGYGADFYLSILMKMLKTNKQTSKTDHCCLNKQIYACGPFGFLIAILFLKHWFVLILKSNKNCQLKNNWNCNSIELAKKTDKVVPSSVFELQWKRVLWRLQNYNFYCI